MHIIIATWLGLMRHWHTGRSMHCVPAQVCMRPFPSDARRVGWCMHVCRHLVNVHYGLLACTIWLRIAMFCALVGRFAGVCLCFAAFDLQPPRRTVAKLCDMAGGLAGVVVQGICAYVWQQAAPIVPCLLASAGGSAPALFSHPPTP